MGYRHAQALVPDRAAVSMAEKEQHPTFLFTRANKASLTGHVLTNMWWHLYVSTGRLSLSISQEMHRFYLVYNVDGLCLPFVVAYCIKPGALQSCLQAVYNSSKGMLQLSSPVSGNHLTATCGSMAPARVVDPVTGCQLAYSAGKTLLILHGLPCCQEFTMLGLAVQADFSQFIDACVTTWCAAVNSMSRQS